METPSTTAYVRKISTPRRLKETVVENNFIKTNKSSIKHITTFKKNIINKEEKKFYFGNSTEILKTRSGLTINPKKVEQEFDRLKLHDEKLQKKILEFAQKKALELSKIKKQLESSKVKKKNIQKKQSRAIAVQTREENIPTESATRLEKETCIVDNEPIQELVYHKPVQELVYEPEKIPKIESVVPVQETLEQTLENSKDEEVESEVEDLEDEAIQIQHILLNRDEELRISQKMVDRILEGREDFWIHGNYLKKFGIHRGSMTKFWDFLGLLSKEILDEILETQLDYVMELCDNFVDDLIKAEL